MSVVIRQLTKVYDKHVVGLNFVDLTIENGVLGLLGPNGAGKTTLMRILATLLDPTSGTATVDGYDVQRQRAEVRRILGYLPQQFGLYPQLTCREFLEYIAMLYGIPPSQRPEAIERTLHQVHLEEFASRPIRALSGGMKQRLGIGQAVIARPRLLIVDEPTVGLDPEERVRIRSLIGELAQNRVVILSTHIVGDVTATATSIALLRAGEVIFNGSQKEMLAEVRGRVWRARVEEAMLPQVKLACAISNINHTPEGLEARLIAENVTTIPGLLDATPAEAELEDAYIWRMGARAIAEKASVPA